MLCFTDLLCRIKTRDALIIGGLIGIGRLSAILPIIGIGRLICWYQPTVIFASCALHVTEIKFMYASMYVIC